MYAKLLKIPNSVLISRVGTIFIKWLCKCLSYTLPNKSTFNLRSHVQSSPLSEWWSCISDLIVPTLTFVPVASPVTPFTRVLNPPITCPVCWVCPTCIILRLVCAFSCVECKDSAQTVNVLENVSI